MPRTAEARRALGLALAALVLAGSPARALDVPADEWDRLKACEKDLCTMVLDKEPGGDDLRCAISKTWARTTLKGGEKKGMMWGFGDAQCGLNLTLSRADILAALTRPEHTVQIPLQTVKCRVERTEEVQPVTIKLAPKLKFKRGRAHKVWINVQEVDGPEDIKGTVVIAAGLEDSLGLFHRPLIKSINKFLHKQCAERYRPESLAKDAKAGDDETDAASEEAGDKTQAATAKAAAAGK